MVDAGCEISRSARVAGSGTDSDTDRVSSSDCAGLFPNNI